MERNIGHLNISGWQNREIVISVERNVILQEYAGRKKKNKSAIRMQK